MQYGWGNKKHTKPSRGLQWHKWQDNIKMSANVKRLRHEADN